MSTIFTPFDLAGQSLSNRIVMAPLTRARAPLDVATERVALYYAQRATAGLIISEGTPISREGQGYLFNPGIFTAEQIEGWRLTTESVHAVGGKIFAQLWHVGRVSHISIQDQEKAPVAPTAKQAMGAMAFGYREDGTVGRVESSPPRALETAEVARVVEDFAQAATNAIEAGFDGVEIHGANGYLIEQFLNPTVNERTDQYTGATIKGRIRFALEVVDAVVARVGKNRVGIRLSPFSQAFDTHLFDEASATYEALIKELGLREMAYVHLKDRNRVDPELVDEQIASEFDALLSKARSLLPQTAILLAGGLDLERASRLIETGAIDLAVFGRAFISNPDLVARFRHGWPLSPANRDTFYGGGAEGYIDYPAYSGG